MEVPQTTQEIVAGGGTVDNTAVRYRSSRRCCCFLSVAPTRCPALLGEERRADERWVRGTSAVCAFTDVLNEAD